MLRNIDARPEDGGLRPGAAQSRQLAAAIKLARAGLRAPEKPIGYFLLAGPTGVGKTEVARQLARMLGLEFLRFDMSEYMERHTVSRLIGAPPGYVGFDQGGLLTDAGRTSIRTRCSCSTRSRRRIPTCSTILLQVMDHGKLTDNNGRKVDFRHVILIMTTNAGAPTSPGRPLGFGRSSATTRTIEAIKRLFRAGVPQPARRGHPVRRSRPREHEQVVDKFMDELEVQLADRKVIIELADGARRWLAREGLRPHVWRPAAGARDPGAPEETARRGSAVRQAVERRRHSERRRQGRGRRCRAGLRFPAA